MEVLHPRELLKFQKDYASPIATSTTWIFAFVHPGKTELMMTLPSAAACCLLALAEGRMGISGTQENNACSAGQCLLPAHVLLLCLLLPAGRSAFLPAMSALQMGFFKRCNMWRYHISYAAWRYSHTQYKHIHVIGQRFSDDLFFLSGKNRFMKKAYGTICLLHNTNEFQGNSGFPTDISLEFFKQNNLNFQVIWIIQIIFSSEFDPNFFWLSIF